MTKLGRQNYKIDPKLKEGKDFPSELELLLDALDRIPVLDNSPALKLHEKRWITVVVEGADGSPRKTTTNLHSGGVSYNPDNPPEKAKFKKYLKELGLLEKTFLEFFINPLSREVTRRCARRINLRIKELYPDFRYEGGPHKIYWLHPFRQSRKEFKPLLQWGYLAQVISDHRAIKLFHQCPWCKKVFFSKQKKKFDTRLCKNKLLSNQRVQKGLAKEAMKHCRERKKKQTTTL